VEQLPNSSEAIESGTSAPDMDQHHTKVLHFLHQNNRTTLSEVVFFMDIPKKETASLHRTYAPYHEKSRKIAENRIESE